MAFDGRFTGTPWLSFGTPQGGNDYRFGWPLTLARRDGPDMAFGLEAAWRERANDNAPEHTVGFKLTINW